MRRLGVLLATASIVGLAVLPAQAQNVKKVNFTTSPRISTPIPKKVDPRDKTAWVCSTPAGWCYMPVGYLGEPCTCCNAFGCAGGVVTGGLDHQDNTASR